MERVRLNAKLAEGVLYVNDGTHPFGRIEVEPGDIFTYERRGKFLKVIA